MKCLKCGYKNRAGVGVCKGCGQPLIAEKTCPQCGHANPQRNKFCRECGHSLVEQAPETPPPSPMPTSFANGRYQVKEFLGEGGSKNVYLVHDTLLDRDVAFALIKTEKLDDASRTRVSHEARAMGRLGDHPNIIAIYDMGEEKDQPYIVIPLMPGGDVENLIKKAPERRLPIERAVSIAKAVCRGLEYAHGKGIIHRDIKPGNVWLSADGTVKIGDFGLALAIDLSRFTEEGMIIGTALYMPPEQAMGGEITPKADLYSLGAMLYEMVAGRPPFIGDTAVAVITQHIDTSPPISPTWHRADLPPGLEALIMQLLEKDPGKRPGSATDVLRTLETIDLGEVSKAPTEKAPTLDRGPLYHRAFVGRETELKLLQSAFDSAASGNGALMMVAGEAGIGKTAICEQLSTYATVRGGKCLVGHCYEEASLSLPYLAFVEAIRSYVLNRGTRELRKELGTGASDIARIVSEIKERLKVKPTKGGDPDEQRYRLMQAVTGFLSNAARVQPLLVILEDLHDADSGTLEMLTYTARNLAGTRLLIVGTYRDVRVDRTHPLSASLAELHRVAAYHRVLLRGLNADEVQRMISAISGMETPWSYAETVHNQTEGNPLFVQEVLRYLRESGLFTGGYGRWQPVDQTALEMSIPEGLRDVIGKRLSLLSEECNRLLSIAAVIGREFRLQVLQQVADVSEDELYAALEEAKSAVIVEERSTVGAAVTYRFTHAFFRQTLYEEIIAPRRVRLHQQVAHVMEKVYARHLEEHSAELAEHFSHSPDAADLSKAVEYSEMAAERATAVYAWRETVRLLEQVLKVQQMLDPDDKGKRCDLLVRFGDALDLAGQLRRIFDEVAPEALSLAESINDHTRAAQVCSMTAFALMSLGPGTGAFSTPEASQWLDRCDHYAEPDTVDRAIADHLRGAARILTGRFEEGYNLLNRALDLSHRLGDRQTFWQTAGTWLLFTMMSPQKQDERLHLVKELVEIPRDGLPVRTIYYALYLSGFVFIQWGQRQRAEEVWREVQLGAERTRLPVAVILSMIIDAILAILDGRLEEAVEIMDHMQAVGDEMGFSGFARSSRAAAAASALSYLRRYDELEDVLSTAVLAGAGPLVEIRTAYIMALKGRDIEAAKVLDQIVAARPDIGTIKDITPVHFDSFAIQTSVLTGHREATELLLRQLSSIRMPIVIAWHYCLARLLGAAAHMLGRPKEARSYYDKALEVTKETRHRPELALTRLQLAELLLEHYPKEKAEALEHLNFAIKEFRDMKMKPYLERALKHKEILGA